MATPVALCHITTYAQPELANAVQAVLEAAQLGIRPGQKILVKPNLLMAHDLSCANAAVVASACQWLLAHGAQITVADSPAFGTCASVAKAIGLSQLLRPLNLAPHNFQGKRQITLNVPGSPQLAVAREALECDSILSIPRVKAHSQVRITLAVKNCYGCIPGLRKAIAHSRFGQSLEYFCACVASLWQQLPPVQALVDGVVAMHVTGPRHGQPYKLGLVAASASAPAVDATLMTILGVAEADAPVAQALRQLGVAVEASYPLEKPEDFSAPGFEVPGQLKNISFNPLVLAKSMARRLWLEWRGSKN